MVKAGIPSSISSSKGWSEMDSGSEERNPDQK